MNTPENDGSRRPRLSTGTTASDHRTLPDKGNTDDGLTCPDCGAGLTGRQMIHEETCPLQSAVDKATEKDEKWFKARPGATERTRPVARAEAIQIAIDGGWRPVGDVHVLRTRMGLMYHFTDGERSIIVLAGGGPE